MSRSNLSRRVEKLERSEIFASPKQLMRRLQDALNGAALRITGRLLRAAPRDSVTRQRIFDDLGERFIRNLSDRDLELLQAELQRPEAGSLPQKPKEQGEEGSASANQEPIAE